MQPILTHAVSRFVCLTALAGLTLTPPPHTHGQSATVTYTETFDDGSNEGNWTFGVPNIELIEPEGGNPGSWLHSPCDKASGQCLEFWYPTPKTSPMGDDNAFTGNYRKRGVTSVGIDLITLFYSHDGSDGPGNDTFLWHVAVVLTNDNGNPDDFSDNWGAYYVGEVETPKVGEGWKPYDFDIPSDATETPPGWTLTTGGPNAPENPDWNDLMENVSMLAFSYLDPTQPATVQPWGVGMDNARITYQESTPPTYAATVLPQLDPTSDPLILTRTAPAAINDARVITGALGNDEGFRWSPDEGGVLLQPQFADLATAAAGSCVNAAGDIGGTYAPAGAAFDWRPFVYSHDNTFTALPTLGDDLNASVSDMNNAGVIVGSSENAPGGGTFGGPTSAVFWADGAITEIGSFGGQAGYASAINNNNVIVGASNTSKEQALQPFRWTEDGGFEMLPQLVDGVPAMPADINDNGLVIGRAGVTLQWAEAVIWDQDSEIHVLPRLYPDAVDIDALAVNNAGMIVGTELHPQTWLPEPRIWIDGEVHDLQQYVEGLSPDITLRSAVDINDNGDIVVEAQTEVDGDVQLLTVILTPDADPSIPGDLNGDGVVDNKDLFLLLADWGACADPNDCPADLTDTGMVDAEDLFILLDNWS